MSSFKCSVCVGRFARDVRELKGNGLGVIDRKLAWWATIYNTFVKVWGSNGNFRKVQWLVGFFFFWIFV